MFIIYNTDTCKFIVYHLATEDKEFEPIRMFHSLSPTSKYAFPAPFFDAAQDTLYRRKAWQQLTELALGAYISWAVIFTCDEYERVLSVKFANGVDSVNTDILGVYKILNSNGGRLAEVLGQFDITN